MSDTLTTKFRGKAVRLTQVPGEARRWKIDGTKMTVSMGQRFFVLRDENEKVVTIRSTLRHVIRVALS